MAEIIDLTLLTRSRRLFLKLLEARGLAYFLREGARRPFQIEPSKVSLVVRTAARGRSGQHRPPPRKALEYCREEIRRDLIRRVAEEMLKTGL